MKKNENFKCQHLHDLCAYQLANLRIFMSENVIQYPEM